MSDAPASPTPLPPSIERTLKYFRSLGRDEKMQALVSFARKLEPLPPRLAALDRAEFNVPECQTRVDIFPERRDDGTLHFYADVNARQSPTIAAVLAVTLQAINDRPPAVPSRTFANFFQGQPDASFPFGSPGHPQPDR